MALSKPTCDSQTRDWAFLGLSQLQSMGEIDSFEVLVEKDHLRIKWGDPVILGWTECAFETRTLSPGNTENDDVLDICEDVMES
jgi:hypothetical protein